MDEAMDPDLAKALERYALVGGILHRRGERGDVVRQVQELAESELVLQDGTTHLSRATLYRILKAAREGGAHQLRRRRRKDRGSIRAIDAKTVARLVALRTEYPRASAPVLIRTLELQGEVAAGQLRPSTVRRILRNLAPRAREDTTKRAYRRFEVAGPMALWQGDASPGPWLHGQRLQLYAWLDAYSRAVVAARYYLNQRLPAFDDCLWRAIARHGVPSSVHIDNGSPYVSRHFLRVLADLGIRPIHATPRQPTGKGRIERLFKTIQDQVEPVLRELIDRREITTLDAVNDLLARWIEEYNHRPHGTTKQAPCDLLGETKPYPDLRRLGEIFLWREERKVTKRGEISLGGNHYAVPDDLVGLRVTVAFHPFDLREVYVELKGSQNGPPGAAQDQTITAKPVLPVAHLALPKLTEPARRQRKAPGGYLQALPARPGQTPAPPPAFALTDASLAALLQATLGRELHIEELDLVRRTLERPGLPLPAEADLRLRAFIRRAGRDLHLSRYLAAIMKERDV